MTYMQRNLFSHFLLHERSSVQVRDSTTGRITLIITPKSAFNAHLINIFLIIGLIMFLKVLETWETVA